MELVDEALLIASGKPWKLLEHSPWNYDILSVEKYPLDFGTREAWFNLFHKNTFEILLS